MDRISFPYRSSSHLVLLHVVAESGAWEKHGLEVDYDRHISSGEALIRRTLRMRQPCPWSQIASR